MKYIKFIVPIFIMSIFSCSNSEKWETYIDKKGNFKIDFLGEPTIKTESQNYPFGNVDWTVVFIEPINNDNLSYSVMYADFPSNIITSDSIRLIPEFMLFTQSDLADKLGAESANEMKNKQIQKYPGRQFGWTDKVNQIGYARRVYLVKNRVYQLEVKFKMEKNFNNDIEDFLDKFSLVDMTDNKNPEIIPEKPLKKFEAAFPGQTKSTENIFFHAVFGNISTITEIYETPHDLIDLPMTKNIMYGVNYAKLPDDSLKALSEFEIKDFVRSAFIKSIKNQNGTILWQKDIDLNGIWGTESEGIMLNNQAVMHMKAFVINDYYYQIMVISKNGLQENDDATNFLNSFKLK